MKDNAFYTNHSIRIGGELFDFASPRVMGILNLTDDSFFAGSRLPDVEALLARAKTMIEEGADVLDIGAYSTRPGGGEVPEEVEMERVIPAVKAVAEALPGAVISVDTFRAKVAGAAVEAGAHVINDISGGRFDEGMFDAVADLGVPYVLMHSRGNARDLHSKVEYEDVVNEVVLELSVRLEKLRMKGVADVIVDPGFGFSKTAAHNFALLNRLDEFSIFDAPLLVGLSRKTMIWRTLGITPEEAGTGTTALNMVALQKGGDILRVHDVKEAKQTIELWKRMQGSTTD